MERVMLQSAPPSRAPERQGGRRRSRIIAHLPELGLSLSLLAAALAIFAPSSSAAGDIVLEAEAFLDSEDHGLDPVTIVTCTTTSGGLAVDGVDATGDAIVLGLSLTDRFCFESGIRSGGDDTLVRVFQVSFLDTGDGSVLIADTLTTPPGTGVG
jgi:hypothetical protein